MITTKIKCYLIICLIQFSTIFIIRYFEYLFFFVFSLFFQTVEFVFLMFYFIIYLFFLSSVLYPVYTCPLVPELFFMFMLLVSINRWKSDQLLRRFTETNFNHLMVPEEDSARQVEASWGCVLRLPPTVQACSIIGAVNKRTYGGKASHRWTAWTSDSAWPLGLGAPPV